MGKTRKKGFDSKNFLKAIEELGNSKGISTDVITEIIKESFQITFTKKLNDEDSIFKGNKNNSKNSNKVKLNDALVRCDIDLDKGKIELFHQFLVVNDEDIQDDFIEISVDDPAVKESGLHVGDYFETPISLDEFDFADARKFQIILNQKLAHAEKAALLESFSTKIGEIVTGTVKKCDPHSVIVNLGRTNATLYSKDLIGGKEKFNLGEQIKVYVKGIGRDDKKGALIEISRSDKGFLQKLFENEIHEIYDKTVIIKDIARFSGIRSKVSVYSNDPNVDASGACIGLNGNRIQAIVAQLGSGKETREKIDIITYKSNLGLYIEECLKPGSIIGVKIDKENNSAIAIAQDGSKSVAIGLKGTNVKLAKELCKLNSLDVIEESEAIEKGIEFKTIEEFTAEARDEERMKYREESLRQLKESDSKNVEKEIVVNFTDKDEYEDEIIEETIDDNVVNEEVASETKEEKNQETQEIEVAKPVKKQPVYEQTEVKTTTTLEDLEKSLEEEKRKEQEKEARHFKKKKERKEENKEDTVKKDIQKMDIYSAEELADLDEEFDDYDEFDDEDYSDYDSDSYYDD